MQHDNLVFSGVLRIFRHFAGAAPGAEKARAGLLKSRPFLCLAAALFAGVFSVQNANAYGAIAASVPSWDPVRSAGFSPHYSGTANHPTQAAADAAAIQLCRNSGLKGDERDRCAVVARAANNVVGAYVSNGDVHECVGRLYTGSDAALLVATLTAGASFAGMRTKLQFGCTILGGNKELCAGAETENSMLENSTGTHSRLLMIIEDTTPCKAGEVPGPVRCEPKRTCPANEFYRPSANACSTCRAGWVSPGGNAERCSECFYAEEAVRTGPDAGTCRECPPGQTPLLNPGRGDHRSKCVACPDGHIRAAGEHRCVKCPEGGIPNGNGDGCIT